MRSPLLLLSTLLGPWLIGLAQAPVAGADASLNACLDRRLEERVARVVDPTGTVVYARVVETERGRIRRAATLAPDGTSLADVFERARTEATGEDAYPVDATQVCAVVDLPERDLDAERRVIVSTGLNYAAHAEEAGGGEVFLFPKPSAPTPPYAPVHPPRGTTLLDYEVELAYVLIDTLDPFDPPDRGAFLDGVAFFLSNDVSDREPIIREKALSGPGTGFSEGKGQPGFLPAGPWMVRGRELFAGLEACGASALELTLFVDDEATPRQRASTERMIVSPEALLPAIGAWIEAHGRRTDMPFTRPGEDTPRFYPFAVPEASPRLTAGSIVQTGTPEGVALQAPSPLGLVFRGLLRGRGPLAQFVADERARVAAGDSPYLVPGSVVRARIDGLGEQRFEIGEAGGQAGPHPCDEE